MKKPFLLLFTLLISIATFAQKDELKASEKALKKSDYPASKSSIDQAEGLISNADDKSKAKFYYLKGETYAGLVKTDPTSENIDAAAHSFQSLFDLEEETGSNKYSDLAKPTMDALISEVSAIGIKSYQEKNYSAAKDELLTVYNLSSKDTAYLEYAANAAYLEADLSKKTATEDLNSEKINKETYDSKIVEINKTFNISLTHFSKLMEIGYTGVIEEYSVKNVESGKTENVGSKSEMELMSKSKEYTDPKVTYTDSKKPDIVKNIAYCYVELGEVNKAIEAVKNARKMSPDDLNLVLTEANLQYKLGNKDKFAELMEQAIKLDPTNATLYFNLGVMSMEQKEAEKAKEYYRKAIELKPDYRDAYVNLGSALLEKDTQLVEEMNQNLSNFDKYDEIKARQVELYNEVIPLYEKAFELDSKDIDTIRTLMSLYENVEREAEFQEMKTLYDGLK